ncbi:MAG: molybdenum cofactor guanylyltransferase [Calditrichia bacterium]|nr:molybdenum cofactor guanylyltransferase [Calditrichia bacterium]
MFHIIQENYKKMNAIILAGGKNSRIAVKKAFIKINSNTIIENTIQLFKSEFNRVIIVANKIEDYLHFGVEVISDTYKNIGPLGGIHAGLNASDTYYNFFVACDMPFINKKIIHMLKESINNYDIIIPEHDGYLEPLCAIYSKMCLMPIVERIENRDLHVSSIFDDVKVNKIHWNNYKNLEKGDVFFNINTQHDLEKAVQFSTS